MSDARRRSLLPRRMVALLLPAMLILQAVMQLTPVASGASGPVGATAGFSVPAGTTGSTSIEVNVPAKPPKADILIAIDTTGSMGSSITQAKADAISIVNGVQASVADTQFAVVDFRDSLDANEYQVRQMLTADPALVSSAINAMGADGGNDAPEAHNLVFHNSYSPTTGGDIGWRQGTKKIVVVISDAEPHGAGSAANALADCEDTSPDPHGLKTATELAGMAAADRTLIMIRQGSTASVTLECYQSIAGRTTGGIGVNTVAGLGTQIVNLITTTFVGNVDDLHLDVTTVPSGASAGWIAFDPTSMTATTPSTKSFTANVSVPAGTAAGEYTFGIKAVADGTDIQTMSLTVTVPPPPSDFTITAGSPSISFPQGASGTSQIVTTAIGATGSIALSATIDPAIPGLSASVAPPSVTSGGSSTLTVSATAAVDPGVYDVKVTGVLDSNTHAVTVSVTVVPEIVLGQPALTGVYHVGPDTWYAGRLAAAPSSSYDITLVSAASCPGGVMSPTAAAFGTFHVTTNASGAVFFRDKLLGAVPSGPFVAARVSGPLGTRSDLSPCVIDGPDNDTWPRALPLTLTGSLTSQSASTQGWIDLPGRERWYRFTVQPGARVQVDLSNLPADYDIVLFKDVKRAYDELLDPSSTTALTKLGAEYAASGFTASGFTASGFTASGFTASGFTDSVYSASGFTASGFTASGFTASGFTASGFTDDAFSASGFTASGFTASGFTASGFTASGFTGDPFSGAQTRSLVAIASTTGTGDEVLAANTWTNTGDYYIRVSGKNGASSLAQPFTLGISQNGGLCNGIAPSTLSSPAATGGTFKTIILTDSSRLPGNAAEQSALQSKLTTFKNRTDVSGVVVDLANDPKVAALNLQADNNPACVYAKNLVAEAIRDVVVAHRAANTSGGSTTLAYVVLVGGDDVIPFFRNPDNSNLGPESAFVPPVKSDSASEASLRNNYVLSQDAYGAGTQISLYSSTFPIPELAVGRLVETASEVSGMLDAYTAANGVVTPRSSLVTGYDFLSDAADVARTSLTAGTGVAADTLIAPYNIAPTDPASWTAAQLKAKFLAARHDIVFLAGHFNANSALAADFKTSVFASDLTSSTVDQSNVIVLSLGCHSGYNIVDGAAVPGVTQPLDWPQAFARKKMTAVLGTGYQYGDTEFIEYSERIYTDIAQQLRYGSGPVAIGKALVAAKLGYLTNTPDIRGLHEKALRQASLYGLPMLGVNLPSGRGLSDPTDGTIGSTTGFGTAPGSTLGLQSASLTLNPSLTSVPVVLKDLGGGSSLTATYLRGLKGVVSNPGEPTIPLDSVDVGKPGFVLRGVGFLGGTYTDQTVVPLTGAPATELKTAHTSFTSSTFFPSRMWSTNYFDALTPGGTGTKLLVTPAQHKAINPGDAQVTLRKFSNLQLKLFYSQSTAAGAGSEGPAISDVTATVSGGVVTFSAKVVGDPRAGVQEVWITYTGLGNTWQSVQLDQDPSVSSRWSKAVPLTAGSPTQIQYMVQAVNGFGVLTVSDLAGAYHKTTVGSSTPAAATTLSLAGTPTTGAYGSTASVSATLKAGSTPIANKAVTFSIGTSTRTAQTNASGVATVNLPLTSSPGVSALTASFAGDASYLQTGDSRPLTITKAGTSLTLSVAAASIPVGAPSGVTATLKDATGTPIADRTVYLTLTGPGPTPRTVTVTTDFQGRASLGTLDLTRGAYAIAASFGSAVVDPVYGASTATGNLTVTGITATLGFTGNFFWSAGSATTAPVTLAGQVTIPAGGAVPITNAGVEFLVFNTTDLVNSAYRCSAPVLASGAASCVVNLPLGDWTVIMTIPTSNGYFTATHADAVVVTVYQATATKFATGAGHVTDNSPNTLPVKVSTTKNRGNFGFLVSYKNGTTTPQGVAVYSFRATDGYDYIFTTTSWTGGGLSFGTGTASFSNKCSVTVINPATRRVVSGAGGANYTCRYDITDGSTDKLALSVYSPTGALYHQAGTSSVQLKVNGGGIVIKK